jgi:endo-1,4-beta-xylanase
MPTRRALLNLGSRAVAISVLSPISRRLLAQAQPAPQNTTHPDEMTTNSAPQPVHYVPPDFGPVPASLPAETVALSGRNSLKEHARRQGMIAGAAVVVRAFQKDPALQQLLADQYAILVPEAELKWRALRPTASTFDFSLSDELFAFAKQHSMLVRGHTLVWHNSVPDWMSKDAAQLDVRRLLVEHIHTVVSRYRGRVHSWDVVNEAILPVDKQQNGMRRSFWYDAVGPDYMELAYRAAREADPHVKLVYNDYGVEYDSDENAERRKCILATIERLRQKNVPLDAVGIQSHIHAGSPNSIGRGLADYIQAIGAMGLEVYLTEMDVNEDDLPFDDVARRDQVVADTYRQFLEVALASPNVKMMLTWGVSDRRTWLNDGPTHHRKQPNRPQRSLPFDPQYRPTPAYFAIRDSFDDRSKA